MGFKGSLPSLQESASVLYPEPHESNQHHTTLFLQDYYPHAYKQSNAFPIESGKACHVGLHIHFLGMRRANEA
jgi:hypothetical protein